MITILEVIRYLLMILTYVIIIQAVMSWLIAFNVINTYNDTVRAIWVALQRLTDPLYRPIRRIMPDFGALDLSPLVLLLLLGIVSNIVIPRIEAWYMGYAVL